MNFPLPIPEKINTPELEAYFKSFSPQIYLSADEINIMVQALNELNQICIEQKLTSETLGQAVTTFPDAEIIYDTDQFNFTSNLDNNQYRIEYLQLLQNLRGVFQGVLTSGQTIKTINKTSLLGSGNIDVKFTPIYHEVLSSSLSTQDVTGVKNYLNALTPNITISANSILKVIVTDTGQIFEVKVNSRSVGQDQTSFVSVDILEVRPTKTHTIIQYIPALNLSATNYWIGWSRSTSNMLNSNPNGSYGTGIIPAKIGTWFADCNVINIINSKKVKKIRLSIRNATIGNTQMYVVVANRVDDRGNEMNGVVIVNELFKTFNSNSFYKDDFVIPAHSLSVNSVMYVFFRNITPNAYQHEGVQINYEFE